MNEPKKRFECYLNIQKTDGVKADAVIISGSATTEEEARFLFDHALETYLKHGKLST